MYLVENKNVQNSLMCYSIAKVKSMILGYKKIWANLYCEILEINHYNLLDIGMVP